MAAVSGFLAGHGANIVDAQQHTDKSDDAFFMRVEFELAGMDIAQADVVPALQLVADRFGMNWGISWSDRIPVVGIMVSQLEHCLIDLLARHRMGELQVRIPIIISNHAELASIAAAFGIPFACIPVTAGEKEAAEARAIEILKKANCDLVVLARYMQILSPTFLSAYPMRIINIHHGFLPAFAGARAYNQAHERGVKLIGATSYYVTDILDDGPIIQDVIRVSHRDSVEDLVRKGRDLERLVLARAVRAHVEDRIVVHGTRTVVFE